MPPPQKNGLFFNLAMNKRLRKQINIEATSSCFSFDLKKTKNKTSTHTQLPSNISLILVEHVVTCLLELYQALAFHFLICLEHDHETSHTER